MCLMSPEFYVYTNCVYVILLSRRKTTRAELATCCFFLSVIKCIRNSGCAPTFLSGNQLMVTWCPLSLVKYPFASQQSLFTSHATQSCLFHSVVKCWGFGFTSQASFIFIQEFLVVILFLPGTLLVLIWVSFLLFQQYPAVRMTVVYCCNAC